MYGNFMTNEEFRLQAIEELVPKGSTFHYHSSGKKRETYTLVFDPSKESDPTKEQIQAKVAELQTIYDAQAYARSRKVEYDKLNQNEMMYDDEVNSTTTWKDAILAIKAKYPKPE